MEFRHPRGCATRAQAILGVAVWIQDRYSHQRLHSALGERTPVEVELPTLKRAAQPQLAIQPLSNKCGQGHTPTTPESTGGTAREPAGGGEATAGVIGIRPRQAAESAPSGREKL